MKYIKIPEPVSLFNIVTGETMLDEKGGSDVRTFERFVLERLVDPKWGTSVKMIMMAAKISEQAKGANGVLVLEDADYDELKQVTETPDPRLPYDQRSAHCLIPFMKAIAEASDTASE